MEKSSLVICMLSYAGLILKVFAFRISAALFESLPINQDHKGHTTLAFFNI
jgi:hypothetical protein